MLRKYPRTRHLLGSRLQPGDHDLAAVPFAELRGRHIVIEEKVDGANCGIRFDADATLRLQSRGHTLVGGPRERQFDRLKRWAASIVNNELFDALGDQYVLYGEWTYAKHTVFYDALPHHFLEFDVLDTATDRFLETPRRRQLLAGVPLTSVPVLWSGPATTADALTAWAGPSAFATPAAPAKLREAAVRLGLDPDVVARQSDATGRMEGLYIKVEQDGVVVDRLKWVRADFTAQVLAGDDHWHDRPIVPNQLAHHAGV
jgi:hypothetical protein